MKCRNPFKPNTRKLSPSKYRAMPAEFAKTWLKSYWKGSVITRKSAAYLQK